MGSSNDWEEESCIRAGFCPELQLVLVVWRNIGLSKLSLDSILYRKADILLLGIQEHLWYGVESAKDFWGEDEGEGVGEVESDSEMQFHANVFRWMDIMSNSFQCISST